MEEVDAAGAFAQQEGQQRDVGFFGVAGAAAKHQVVRPVVGGLPLAGSDVVQGHLIWIGFHAAIGADRAVPVDEPFAVRLIRAPAGPSEGLAGDA